MLKIIAKELGLSLKQVETAIKLLDEGATIPFIARYRKEATDNLDELNLHNIVSRRDTLLELNKRKEAILSSLAERELLNEELNTAINSATALNILEDIYLPYKPKRKTRASMARARGLAPLAKWLMDNKKVSSIDPLIKAKEFIKLDITDFVGTDKEKHEKLVLDAESALAGARDIIAEDVNENSIIRQRVRTIFAHDAILACSVATGKEEEGIKFKDYFDYSEKSNSIPSHRILASYRGEEEGFLKLKLRPNDEEYAIQNMESMLDIGKSLASIEVRKAVQDSYQRLLAPSLENELRNILKKRADTEAINVFADNLKELLLAPPLGSKNIMGIDPGFRTGCKVVCCNKGGKLLEYTVINPHTGSDTAKTEAEKKILNLIQKHNIEALAIGNGTAGRETESFLRSISNFPSSVAIIMVSESGASIYSASEVARAEFPDLDLTYRGAISIARRLADPLAELVKIDPKSIGVGQYQHDVNQGELKKSLDDTVIYCVNSVGVDINTASEQLLTYVSGLGTTLAKNIIKYRHEHGAFTKRKDLLKVTRLGAKAFEQCSGFLRINNGSYALDASAVHPESYHIVEKMAQDCKVKIEDLINNSQIRSSIELDKYVDDTVGMPTLIDIMSELEKPGRDPRKPFEIFSYTEGIADIKDLQPGMHLNGIITNVTAFGAFVDVGVHQDGLVHISQLSNTFVKRPSDVVKTGQYVRVKVMDVDIARKRISLSMKD